MPASPSRRPGLAALLSLIVPGLGQLYNRDLWRGLFWLVIAPPTLYFAPLLAWLCHICAALTALQRAERKNSRRRYRSGHYGNPDTEAE